MDQLLAAIISHPGLDDLTKAAVLRAFNKVIWIQNDCAFTPAPLSPVPLTNQARTVFARHYIAPPPPPTTTGAGLRGVAWGVGTVVVAGGLQALYQRWM